MTEREQHLDTLKEIKQMMERSSRFISLSGLSGIAAGICALVGAGFAYKIINHSGGANGLRNPVYFIKENGPISLKAFMGSPLLRIALFTFIAAFLLAFLFTYLKSRKTHIPLWGSTARRLMVSVGIPMVAGGLYLWKLIENGVYGYIAPGCLLFYGMALLSASRYTPGEIKYLGYGMIGLGVINLFFIGYGIYFWAVGFGLLHIIYGSLMWWKYERKPQPE